MKVDKRSQIDLALLQLSGTHILNERQRSGKSKYKVRLVQGSCVTCTEVGAGYLSKRRSSASHRTAEENISSLTRVVEICPPSNSLQAYVESTGIPMIGANIHAFREYTKRSGMALKHGPGSGTSSKVGFSMEAKTPEDTAKRTA